MSFNEKNTKHVTQLFHYNLIIFIVLRCLNCFCMVINHLKSMKYILIIISFINTTLWKLAKLLPPHQAFLPNRHFMKDPYIHNVTISLPPPRILVFKTRGGFFLFNLSHFFGLSRFWITLYMSVYDPTRPTSKNDATWLHAWEYKQVLKQRNILCPGN